MQRARVFQAILLSVLLQSAEARAALIPLEDSFARIVERQHDVKLEVDRYCIALAVYFEDGSTTDTTDGQRRIAEVVMARARANATKWGGRDICSVVFYKRLGVCQFSFACLPLARRTPQGGPRWERALAIASEAINGQLAEGETTIRYYMNPAITSDRNACRFRKEFVPVAEFGRHEFFREPTEAERQALASSEPIECQRYKAAIELRKKLAKKAMEKRRKAALARVKTSRRLARR
jgi:hypothetical protein